MKKRTVYLLIILLMTAGTALFLYPAFSSYIAEQNQISAVDDYDETVRALQEEKLAEEWRKAREYNETLMGEPVHDPFLEGSGKALPQNYLDILHISETMGTVEIPKISVKLPIYHGTDAKTLDKGVGHMRQTALPIGSDGTHAVLTGHTGLPNAKMFDNLTRLVLGDKFYIHVLGETLAYEVDQISTVLPEEVALLNPIEGEDHVTLLTCTPYGVNTHRLLVRGVRVEYSEEEFAGQAALKEGLSVRDELILQTALIAGVVLAILVTVLILRRRRRAQARAALRRRRSGDGTSPAQRTLPGSKSAFAPSGESGDGEESRSRKRREDGGGEQK